MAHQEMTPLVERRSGTAAENAAMASAVVAFAVEMVNAIKVGAHLMPMI